MKLFFVFSLIIFGFGNILKANKIRLSSNDPNLLIAEINLEIQLKWETAFSPIANFQKEIKVVNSVLLQSDLQDTQKINLLIQKEILKEKMNSDLADLNNEISKIRYIKGL